MIALVALLSRTTMTKATLFLLAVSVFCTASNAQISHSKSTNLHQQQQQHRKQNADAVARRWPNKQLNVFADRKTLNASELALLDAAFAQLEHRTCVRVHRVSEERIAAAATPAPILIGQPQPQPQQQQTDRHYVYVFKNTAAPPALGLSSLGCLRRGRQSLVLTQATFEQPQLVLRYHIMRTLGVDGIERPDEQFALLTHQKIADARQDDAQRDKPLLSERDVTLVKELYECAELQSTLNSVAAHMYTNQALAGVATATTTSIPRRDYAISDKMIDQAAKSIVDFLLHDDTAAAATSKRTNQTAEALLGLVGSDSRTEARSCASKQECSARPQQQQQQQQRPVMLQLDEFHAQDPHLQQTNQMTLTKPASFRQMDGGKRLIKQQQQQLVLPPASNAPPPAPMLVSPSKSEMTISFEQAGDQQSQVLKVCSCTCQTMTPSSVVPIAPPPSEQQQQQQSTTLRPPADELVTLTPSPEDLQPSSEQPATTTTTTTSSTTPADQQQQQQGQTSQPTAWPTWPATLPTAAPLPTTTTPIAQTSTTTTTAAAATTTTQEAIDTSTSTQAALTTTISPNATALPSVLPTQQQQPQQQQQLAANTCDSVEWVRPNKTVYGSAKIVWDVDRANQNYFLCQSSLNGELVPGKTHGFSCKMSSEGRAYDMHTFNVLTKPENVNLAWVQRTSDTLGKTNLPVVGGRSRAGTDVYVVARCLVRDENNDIITLIGYVNTHNVGWFPFDDIQIECGQYDVLACVSGATTQTD